MALGHSSGTVYGIRALTRYCLGHQGTHQVLFRASGHSPGTVYGIRTLTRYS
jgi:hypothetical protein